MNFLGNHSRIRAGIPNDLAGNFHDPPGHGVARNKSFYFLQIGFGFLSGRFRRNAPGIAGGAKIKIRKCRTDPNPNTSAGSYPGTALLAFGRPLVGMLRKNRMPARLFSGWPSICWR